MAILKLQGTEPWGCVTTVLVPFHPRVILTSFLIALGSGGQVSLGTCTERSLYEQVSPFVHRIVAQPHFPKSPG